MLFAAVWKPLAVARTAGGTVAVITENVLGIITHGVFLPTTRPP